MNELGFFQEHPAKAIVVLLADGMIFFFNQILFFRTILGSQQNQVESVERSCRHHHPGMHIIPEGILYL